ncbi:helix-turn-helix domain-containing protein [Nocardia brasiliensis]|uniref:Transcriptional regulator n=1 Tax=Nocardia brasiliensis (strain ATCC 700358 / HUJEG-1) TaxID=1133849 RepID=K0F5N3_NOCB7|nr:helix-turn-helix domain-containing protein [Nocardia brasiliensis]AFU04645.1 hypothetical protein O3I_033480 [Nocardia brasiliensis ATCC 700358]OCF88372.1 hypothetical protein AW168_22055 [Nocardia brasiliensis]
MIVNRWTGIEVAALRECALRLTKARFGEDLGYSEPTVRKWEKATPDRPVRGESAQALDTALARLTDEQRARFRAAMDGGPHRTLAVLEQSIVLEDEVKRRDFGIAIGAALAGSASPLSRIGIGDARRLMERVSDLNSRDQVVGGVSLVREAVDRLDLAKDLLETCTFDESAGKLFMSAAGNLAALAGWLAYDADMHSLALRCYADAFSLANQAGDDELTVHVCLNAAHQSIWLSRVGNGNPHRALGHVARAQDLTRGHPPGRIHALIATRQAQAYGVLGDRTGFGRAVATAWRELDFALEHEPADQCPEWLTFMSPTEVRFHEIRGFGDLGSFTQAADLSAGLALAQAGARNAAVYRAGWAAALANIGDINGAVDQGLTVLADLEDSVSSTRTLRVLEPVRKAFPVDSSSEFPERFDMLTRQAATT